MESKTNTTSALIEKYKGMHSKWDDVEYMLAVLSSVLDSYRMPVFEQAVLWLSRCDKVGPKCKEALKEIEASFENVKRDPKFNISYYGKLAKLYDRIYDSEQTSEYFVFPFIF